MRVIKCYRCENKMDNKCPNGPNVDYVANNDSGKRVNAEI